MSMPSSIETPISNELLAGEELLWSGSPDQKKKGAVSSNRLLATGWIYAPLGIALMIASAILSQGMLRGNTFLFLIASVLGFFIFIMGVFCLRIGYSARFSSQKVFYAITNRRVIILSEGRYVRVISYSKRMITQVQRVDRPDGSGDLIVVVVPGNMVANRQNTLMAISNVRQVEHKLLTMLDGE
jgi:hypothetical protein